MVRSQHLLSEYLQCELYHAVGAYRVAEQRLKKLSDALGSQDDCLTAHDARREERSPRYDLSTVVRLAGDYNRELDRSRHASLSGEPTSTASADWPERDPIPVKLPLSRADRFKVGGGDNVVERDRDQPWRSERNWVRIPRFYGAVVKALDGVHPKELLDQDLLASDRGLLSEPIPPPIDSEGTDKPRAQWLEAARRQLARSVVESRDGTAEPHDEARAAERLDARRQRYETRRDKASRQLAPTSDDDARKAGSCDSSATSTQRLCDKGDEVLIDVITGHLGDGADTWPMFVVSAQAEAHMAMHAVEAWQAMCLGQRARELGKTERKWLKEELERSIALSTFAFSASRIAPWIFAGDEDERLRVAASTTGWENMLPVRCIWIANQVCLLALHRRGYARLLNNEPDQAYNDFHKLQRLIRDAERRVGAAPTRVSGSSEFLAALDAQAHHHIGELYRYAHAHKPALEHFEAASHRIELQEKSNRKMTEVLTSSRWHVELQVSHGKAAYEMGRHKEALIWHLRGWRRFLMLLAADTGMEANTGDIDEAIDWLERIKFEPELRKSEVSKNLGPVVDQLDRITVSRKLGALAGEVLLRLGHLLFVLNIEPTPSQHPFPRPGAAPITDNQRQRAAVHEIKHTLAFDCLRKAAECDPHSTLAAADILKATYRFDYVFHGDLPQEYDEYLALRPAEPVKDHWPRGGSDYERITRAAEYLTLATRRSSYRERPALSTSTDRELDAFLARDLLLDFFMNTDSTNVRKSQVHQLLMRTTPHDDLPGEAPRIEFVCMRRYSSAFPMLPRPSAFRALAGGYFVRLHGTRSAEADVSAEAGQTEVSESAGAGTTCVPAADAQRGAREANSTENSSPSQAHERAFGIVVDPGMDFVENLYRTGYSIGDVDMIIVTHDHVDHIGSLDPLLSLIYERQKLTENEERGSSRGIDVVVSRSVEQRYRKVSRVSCSSLFKLQCFEPEISPPTHAHPKVPIDLPDEVKHRLPDGFDIKFMCSTTGDSRPREEERGHRDLSGLPAYGVCFSAGEGGPSLAITSDTPAPPRRDSSQYEEWRGNWLPALTADVLVTHLSSVPLTELRKLAGRSRKISEQLRQDERELEQIREELEGATPNLKGQINYAQWLGTSRGEPAGIVGAVPSRWRAPSDHPYLAGTLRWAREYMEARGARSGLFVIGELSEELGTMRSKIARRLNDLIFRVSERAHALEELDGGRRDEVESDARPCALTADIGLRVCVHGDEAPRQAGRGGAGAPVCSHVRVLCTTCNLDTDRVPGERYHLPRKMREVCVKGENEGIFYNCPEHDPVRQEDPTFLEQLERFDIFGR